MHDHCLNTFSNESVLPYGTWNDPKNRRMFFEKFASDNNFDPLIIENWSLQRIRAHQVMVHPFISLFLICCRQRGSILRHYGGSITQALKDLFPEIKNVEIKSRIAS